jgi:hypothetical protein
MSTPKQTAANRANSKKSTGPRSAQGKAASRANSFKTGLYARSQIISGEDPAELRALADRYFLRWDPATPEESFLVSTLIDSDWLLRRYSLADAQLWNYHADNEYVRDSPHPKGLNFMRAKEHFPLLQRRSDSAQRTWHRALRDLERIQAKRPAPTPSTGKPASEPLPEPKPNSAQPLSTQPTIGFVPPFSPAPDPPPPDPPVACTGLERPESQVQEPVRGRSDEPMETSKGSPSVEGALSIAAGKLSGSPPSLPTESQSHLEERQSRRQSPAGSQAQFAQPQSAQQEIGFVPSFSPAPDSPSPQARAGYRPEYGYAPPCRLPGSRIEPRVLDYPNTRFVRIPLSPGSVWG